MRDRMRVMWETNSIQGLIVIGMGVGGFRLAGGEEDVMKI
jgi:hypothetical protein